MTLYRQAQLYMAWTFLVFCTSPLWWFEFLVEHWGNAGWLAGGALWLAHGVPLSYLFLCPACGTSAFVRWKGPFELYAPWPRDICVECGTNLDTV